MTRNHYKIDKPWIKLTLLVLFTGCFDLPPMPESTSDSTDSNDDSSDATQDISDGMVESNYDGEENITQGDTKENNDNTDDDIRQCEYQCTSSNECETPDILEDRECADSNLVCCIDPIIPNATFVEEEEDSLTAVNIFFEDFEDYTTGDQVACSGSSDWTTWDNDPCGDLDATVSDEYAYAAPRATEKSAGVTRSADDSSRTLVRDDGNISIDYQKSMVIVYGVDLVMDFGTTFTSGIYTITFWVLVPENRSGYFNTLATFSEQQTDWGVHVFFDVGGRGRVQGGSSTPVEFEWPMGVWFEVENKIDLDNDTAKITVNGNLIHAWKWTLGAKGEPIPCTLSASDFFGYEETDEMYIDNYAIYKMEPI